MVVPSISGGCVEDYSRRPRHAPTGRYLLQNGNMNDYVVRSTQVAANTLIFGDVVAGDLCRVGKP
jgi:hypothetical protein